MGFLLKNNKQLALPVRYHIHDRIGAVETLNLSSSTHLLRCTITMGLFQFHFLRKSLDIPFMKL